MSPAALVASGFAMLIAGWAALFLMVAGVLQPGFALAFGAYALTLAGMVTGFAGLARYRRRR